MTRMTVTIAAALMACTSSLALASGSEARSGDTFDAVYAQGKALLKGRTGGFEKVTYCVNTADGAKKLKSRSIKPHRRGTSDALAAALVNCDAPDKSIVSYMDAPSVQAVLHYLNSRYRLKLDR